MSISSFFDRLHSEAKSNRWLWLFSIFCRVALAAGFLPAGLVKIVGERFASGLSANHPMGHYLEALHLTGFYYTFIGVAQIAAAILLLVPRTVTLGAFIYFPIILNITILTYATRFDGSLFTSPLMTLANLYLLGWNYEKWKYILPFNHLKNSDGLTDKKPLSKKFPIKFFAGVAAAIIIIVLVIPNLYEIKPRNNSSTCRNQFIGSNRIKAGEAFCNCIHKNGEPLNKCLDEYEKAADDTIGTP